MRKQGLWGTQKDFHVLQQRRLSQTWDHRSPKTLNLPSDDSGLSTGSCWHWRLPLPTGSILAGASLCMPTAQRGSTDQASAPLPGFHWKYLHQPWWSYFNIFTNACFHYEVFNKDTRLFFRSHLYCFFSPVFHISCACFEHYTGI